VTEPALDPAALDPAASPPAPASTRPRWPTRLALPLGAGLLVALGFLFQPLLLAPDATGSTDDWRWFTFHWEVARTTILQHGELPVWNPYHCGGNVQLANPQTQELSPLAWPMLVFGVNAGLKLFLLLHLLLGFGAMYWLARDLRLDRVPALFAAGLFAGSGYLFQHLGGGQASFAPFLLMPAALAAYRRSLTDLRYAAATGGILALQVLEGGVYPVPYTALLLTAYAVGRYCAAPDDLRPWTRLLAAGGLAVLLAGVKLLPVLLFLQEQPRHVPSDDGMSLWEVGLAFVSRRLERRFPGHPYVWPEYGAYLGWPVLLLAGWILLRRTRQYLGWLLLTLFFVLLMTGNRGGGLSPHEILRDLPVLRSLHVPSRFGIVVTLGLALLAGAALHELGRALTAAALRAWPRRLLRSGLGLLALLALLDVLTFGQWQMGRFKDRPPARPAAPRFTMTKTNWAEGPSLPRRNLGTVACYEPNGVPRGKVQAGRPAEVFFVGDAAGQVRVTRWSPARVEATLEADGPGLLVLNQNDHRGWQVQGVGVGRASHEGLPAARIAAAGQHTVVFRYRTPGLAAGLSATLLGVLVSVVIARFATPAALARLRSRVRRRLLLVGEGAPGVPTR